MERICRLTGAPGENPDDCTTHEHDYPGFRTQRVVLDITIREPKVVLPESWDWYDIVNVDGKNDNLNVVSIEDIPTNGDHVEQMEEE